MVRVSCPFRVVPQTAQRGPRRPSHDTCKTLQGYDTRQRAGSALFGLFTNVPCLGCMCGSYKHERRHHNHKCSPNLQSAALFPTPVVTPVALSPFSGTFHVSNSLFSHSGYPCQDVVSSGASSDRHRTGRAVPLVTSSFSLHLVRCRQSRVGSPQGTNRTDSDSNILVQKHQRLSVSVWSLSW